MMKVVIALLVFLVGVALADVKIESVFKPEDCTVLAKPGDTVKVHYTGRLTDQTVFDSSLQAGRDPLEFQLGAGRVIPGWERGISGMCIGEKRRLTIPPELAYGDQAVGPIPPGSTLIFDTELVDIPAFGPDLGGSQPQPQQGSIGKSQLGFLVIVGGFIAIVLYLVKAKPEISSSGPRRSSKTSSKRK